METERKFYQFKICTTYYLLTSGKILAKVKEKYSSVKTSATVRKKVFLFRGGNDFFLPLSHV
jgi:hypothetical protein